MIDQKHLIKLKKDKEIVVFVRCDKLLKKCSRWQWREDDPILLSANYRFPKRQILDFRKQVS